MTATDRAVSDCIAGAGDLTSRLDGTNWELIDSMRESSTPAATAVIDALRETMCHDEHALALGTALKSAQHSALRVPRTQAGARVATPVVIPDASPPAPTPANGRRVIDSGTLDQCDAGAVAKKIKDLSDGLQDQQTLKISMTWTITEEDNKS